MVEYGVGPAGHPVHRFGSGTKSLVILPGLTDAVAWNRPRKLTGELLSRLYFPSFREFDVWVVSRPPELSRGPTAREMADGYAAVLDHFETAHVLGISLGGAIATYLAAQHPELLDRLVLVGCGTHLGDSGRRTVRHWRKLSDQQRWTDFHVDYARTVYAGSRKYVVPGLYRLGSRWLPEPEIPEDVVISCDAALEYDGSGVLENVESETLVIGGDRDVLFPERVQRDAAGRLPGGHLATIDAGHAVYEERRSLFGHTVLRFLDEGRENTSIGIL